MAKSAKSTSNLKRSTRSKRSTSRVDIRTVAERAEVSVATVSRTINHVPSVDPKIARRVRNAIKELGYVPNMHARGLVSGKSRLFGVIISDITNPFFPELIQCFEEVAVKSNYEILIGSTGYDIRRMEVCIQRMLERKVDGVAVMTFGIEDPLLDRLAAHGLPLVFIDVAPEGAGMSTIEVDYAAGIRQAVQHLAVLGHRRFGFIAGPGMLHSAEMRKAAFLAALSELGTTAPEEYIFEGDHTMEGGILGMEALLRLKTPPTAVICSNDMTAIGVLHAAARANLKIPEDISVVGFDDIHMARFTVPPLTTIQMSCRDLADNAFEALRSHVESEAADRKNRYYVTTRLNVRQTTSTPKGSLQDLQGPAKRKKTASPRKK